VLDSSRDQTNFIPILDVDRIDQTIGCQLHANKVRDRSNPNVAALVLA